MPKMTEGTKWRPAARSLHSLAESKRLKLRGERLQMVRRLWLLTCAGLALWVLGWKSGSSVWVGWFYKRVVPHWASGHGGWLDVWADRCHARRTWLLSSLAIRGQLYSDRIGKKKRESWQVNESILMYMVLQKTEKRVWEKLTCRDWMATKFGWCFVNDNCISQKACWH